MKFVVPVLRFCIDKQGLFLPDRRCQALFLLLLRAIRLVELGIIRMVLVVGVIKSTDV